MSLPDTYYAMDLEYGDTAVAAKTGQMPCLLAIGLVRVEMGEIVQRSEWLIKPLHDDQLTGMIQGLTGLTPHHFEDASTPFEPVREVLARIRNKHVFSWGHIDSILFRYWATIFEFKIVQFKAVCAYSFLLGKDAAVRPSLKAEATRKGFDVQGLHKSPVFDCELVIRLLEDVNDVQELGFDDLLVL